MGKFYSLPIQGEDGQTGWRLKVNLNQAGKFSLEAVSRLVKVSLLVAFRR
jgi:hypothetical protein